MKRPAALKMRYVKGTRENTCRREKVNTREIILRVVSAFNSPA